jgi:hypothetical protein
MKKVSILAGVLLTVFTANAQVADSVQDPYYQITNVTVTEVDDLGDVSQSEENFVEVRQKANVGEVIAIAREIIAFGKEVYKIVEAGKPVVNTSYAPISVLPYDKTLGKNIDPMDLENWRAPRSKKYQVTYTNGFGMNVVDFTYSVNFSYGGSFNGKGLYITNAEIVPENVSVAWGYTFNAKMKLVGLTNRGTKLSPVAGATLTLYYSVSTVLKEDQNNISYFLSGDGTISRI